jgi:hypothetical protein
MRRRVNTPIQIVNTSSAARLGELDNFQGPWALQLGRRCAGEIASTRLQTHFRPGHHVSTTISPRFQCHARQSLPWLPRTGRIGPLCHSAETARVTIMKSDRKLYRLKKTS